MGQSAGLVPRSRVDNQPRGFVQDDNGGILMEESEINPFRLKPNRADRWDCKVHLVPRFKAVAHLWWAVIDPCKSLFNEFLNPVPCQVMDVGGKESVEAEVFLFFCN